MNKIKEKKNKNVKHLIKVFYIKRIIIVFVIICERIGLTILFANFFNKILRILNIRKNIYTYSNYKRYGNSFRKAFNSQDLGKESILFPMMFGNSSNFNLVNLLLAKYLDTKNHHPIFLVCDSTFGICGKERIGKQRSKMPLFCYECYGGYSKLGATTGIDLHFMSKYFTKQLKDLFQKETSKIETLKTIDDCINYELSNGYRIGAETKKAILRYFFRSTLLNTEEELEIYRRFIKEGVRYYLIMNDFLKNNPNVKKIIIHNGTLSFNNYLFDIAKRNEIDIVTYETFIGNNSFIYKKNDEVMKLQWPLEMKYFYDKNPITEENKLLVTNFFEGLQKGKDMYALLNSDHDNEKMRGIRKYACLFTNLNFDTAVLDRNTIFDSMENWIYEVIDFWQTNNIDTTLVVRVHPAEVKLLTPSSDFIGEKIKRRIYKSNVILFDSTDQVNSYRLIDEMDFALVYSSTIGMETAFLNKKCLVAGDPFYKNEPFVMAPNTKMLYFEELNNLINGKNKFIPNIEALNSFVYYTYFVRIKRFNGFFIQYHLNIDVSNKIENYKNLLTLNNQILEEFYNECIL